MYSERPVVAEKGLQTEVSFSFVFGQEGGPKRHLACSTNHRLSKYIQETHLTSSVAVGVQVTTS